MLTELIMASSLTFGGVSSENLETATSFEGGYVERWALKEDELDVPLVNYSGNRFFGKRYQ